MKIIETAKYRDKKYRYRGSRGRNLKQDLFNTKYQLPGGKYRRVRGEPSIEEKQDNPNYNIPVLPLDDPVVINKIRQALEDYPGIDIEVLADVLGVPVEHVRQVAESNKE